MKTLMMMFAVVASLVAVNAFADKEKEHKGHATLIRRESPTITALDKKPVKTSIRSTGGTGGGINSTQ